MQKRENVPRAGCHSRPAGLRENPFRAFAPLKLRRKNPVNRAFARQAAPRIPWMCHACRLMLRGFCVLLLFSAVFSGFTANLGLLHGDFAAPLVDTPRLRAVSARFPPRYGFFRPRCAALRAFWARLRRDAERLRRRETVSPSCAKKAANACEPLTRTEPMKRTDPEPNCIETAGGFRVKIPNPFPCTLCAKRKAALCFGPRRRRKAYGGRNGYATFAERNASSKSTKESTNPTGKRPEKKFRQGLDIVQAGR